MDRRFMFMGKMSSGGCLPPPLGYIHVYGQNIQTSSSLKPHGQSKLNFIWIGNESLYKWSRSHDQDGHLCYSSRNLYESYSSEPEDL